MSLSERARRRATAGAGLLLQEEQGKVRTAAGLETTLRVDCGKVSVDGSGSGSRESRV